MSVTEIAIAAAIAAAVFFALRRIVKMRKGGCSCCCGECSGACKASHEQGSRRA